MKDSGVEWIGEIPEEWNIVKMRRIGHFSSSGIDKKISTDEVPVKIINYTDIYNNKTMIIDKSIEYMEVTCKEDKKCKNLVEVGDILFTPSSETYTEIGLSAVVYDTVENLSFSYHVIRFNPTVDLNLSFKKYMCNNHFLHSHFSGKAVGTIRKTLNRNDFKEAPVLLPPKLTQTRIATYLDHKVSQIDSLIAKTKQSIEEYKAYKQSLITEVVTKGLDKDVKMKDSGIEWIGEIPEHWEVVRLKDKLHFSSGLPITKAQLSETGVLCINYGDIHSKYKFDLVVGRDKLNKAPFELVKKKKSTLVNTNDFIFCDTSEDIEGCGNCLFIRDSKEKKIIAGSHTIIGRPIGNLFSPFLGYALRTTNIRAQIRAHVTGIKVFSITQKLLKTVKVCLPPYNEQEEIAHLLDQKKQEVTNIILQKQSLITELESYKKSLIYEVVTGKREV